MIGNDTHLSQMLHYRRKVGLNVIGASPSGKGFTDVMCTHSALGIIEMFCSLAFRQSIDAVDLTETV